MFYFTDIRLNDLKAYKKAVPYKKIKHNLLYPKALWNKSMADFQINEPC